MDYRLWHYICVRIQCSVVSQYIWVNEWVSTRIEESMTREYELWIRFWAEIYEKTNLIKLSKINCIKIYFRCYPIFDTLKGMNDSHRKYSKKYCRVFFTNIFSASNIRVEIGVQLSFGRIKSLKTFFEYITIYFKWNCFLSLCLTKHLPLLT